MIKTISKFPHKANLFSIFSGQLWNDGIDMLYVKHETSQKQIENMTKKRDYINTKRSRGRQSTYLFGNEISPSVRTYTHL